MTQTYDLPEWHILVIGHEKDTEPLLDAGFHGPFESVGEAQEYARAWRSLKGLPSVNAEPTPEENEAWSEAGYTFGIMPLVQEDLHAAWTVGLTDPPTRLRKFATEKEAVDFVSTLEGVERGIYYIDPPTSED